MKLQGQWVIQGYFQSTGRSFFTGVVRDRLAERLQRPVRIADYPKGPNWRHTFFWREGTLEYAEAQFFVRIAGEHPVLSAGVCVEKGLEERSALRPRSSCRTFVFANGTWFERFVGTAKEDVIIRHLHDLDDRKDWWVVAHVACELAPDEVDGMEAEALADLLWTFAPIRAAVRRRSA